MNKPLRYYINEIKNNWNNLRWWRARIMERIVHPIELLFIGGSYVLSEEWDNLIILDACRYDVFKEEIKNWKIDGKLEYRISRANAGLFLRENFSKKVFNKIKLKNDVDIIYITANPWVNKEIDRQRIKVVSVWKHHWNDNLGTVLPEAVYTKTLEVLNKYKNNKNKRVIIHFLQPHGPYIKREGKKYIKLDSSTLQAYRENLRLVMPYVAKLCRVLSGKIVITSDHGEAFGEKVWFLPLKVWGHPSIRIEPLIKVPWFVTEGKGDKKLLESELIRLGVKKLKLKFGERL